jgi:hypothetical protein
VLIKLAAVQAIAEESMPPDTNAPIGTSERRWLTTESVTAFRTSSLSPAVNVRPPNRGGDQ